MGELGPNDFVQAGEEGVEYFTLNTGAQMPSVGLGTWESPPELVGKAVVAAVKAGYRHIDCAALYNNEKEVGKALQMLFREDIVRREDLFITSKLWSTHHDPHDVPEALGNTLKDLQLDYLDLYLIHWPFRLKKGGSLQCPDDALPPDIPTTWRAMEAVYKSGKARAVGVSNFSTRKLGDLLAVARVVPAVNQVECHPGWRQEKMHDLCKAHGVHLSGYAPLGSPGTKWMLGNVLSNPVLMAAAGKLGRTPAQVAIRWGIQMGHSVLPKSVNEDRIQENLDVFGWSIPDDLFVLLAQIQQVKFTYGRAMVHEKSPYKTFQDLWDGEI